ncbi:MAG: hypothetical protein IJZ53_03160 [Tyzzerella sp.]|nr:hypothetical protein [Tyzzerella sp.]
MQNNQVKKVENKHNWTDRSLSYLCRSFDQLYRGQKYDEALPVIHIEFLDYTLFPDAPEFYATNMLMNVRNRLLGSSFQSQDVGGIKDASRKE